MAPSKNMRVTTMIHIVMMLEKISVMVAVMNGGDCDDRGDGGSQW